MAGLFVSAIIVAVIIAAVTGDEEDAVPSSGSEPAATTTRGSEFTQVGSVEIQVLSIEAFDATPYNAFNDENLRIHVRVRKIKGDEYDFTLNEWILVTSAGTGSDHSMFCTDCPDPIGDLVLYGDQSIEAYVYFELPPGNHSFTELRYEPLFSSNKGVIAVDVAVTTK